MHKKILLLSLITISASAMDPNHFVSIDIGSNSSSYNEVHVANDILRRVLNGNNDDRTSQLITRIINDKRRRIEPQLQQMRQQIYPLIYDKSPETREILINYVIQEMMDYNHHQEQQQKRQMRTTIITAIIGGSATVISALVSGLVVYFSTR